MKNLIAVSVLASLSGMASAAPSEREVTAKVVQAASSYAKSISCGTSDISPLDVVALSPYTSMDDRDQAEYLIVWEGDIGCLGGSGTSTTNVSSVIVSTGDSYMVNLEKSSPAVSVAAKSGAKLIGTSGESLLFETHEYAEGDANCCPSIRKRITLNRDGAGNWVEQ